MVFQRIKTATEELSFRNYVVFLFWAVYCSFLFYAFTVFGLPAHAKTPSETMTVSQRIEALQEEYQRTLKQVEDGRAQLLRLEGAISILQIVESETSSTISKGRN